jgi:hypothetical protein
MQGAVRSSIAKYSLDLEDLADLDADSGLRQLAPLNRTPSLSSSGILYESVTGEPELVGITVQCKSLVIFVCKAMLTFTNGDDRGPSVRVLFPPRLSKIKPAFADLVVVFGSNWEPIM